MFAWSVDMHGKVTCC